MWFGALLICGPNELELWNEGCRDGDVGAVAGWDAWENLS